MSKARQDFVVDANKSTTLRFTVTDATLLSVDGLTWRLALTPDGAATIEKTKIAGITVIDDETIDIVINDDEIEDAGLYYHVLYQTIASVDTMLARGRGFVRPLPSGISA